MTNTLREYDELRVGDAVGDTGRVVIARTKTGERVPGDTYASWTAICHDDTALHPYVVWTVIARPEGFIAEQGDYCLTLRTALKAYEARGGERC